MESRGPLPGPSDAADQRGRRPRASWMRRPGAEADALIEASSEGLGGRQLVARRVRGAALAWITGRAWFYGIRVIVDPGVFVPRPHGGAGAPGR